MGNKTGLRHAMLNSGTLTGEFCEILTLDAIFGDLVQCEGGLPMPFEALVPHPSTGEMLGVATGVGQLTEGASTTILVQDYQGVYKNVAANKPAWVGARWVGDVAYGTDTNGALLDPLPRLVYAPEATNLFSNGRDIGAPSWDIYATVTKVAGIDGTANASQLTDDSASFEYIFKGVGTPVGNDYSLVFYLKRDGTGIFAVQWATTAGIYQIDPATGLTAVEVSGYFSQGDISVIADSDDWWKVCITFTNNTNASANCYLHPARTDTLGGPATATAQGTNTVDSVELYQNVDHEVVLSYPPLFTPESAIVTRTARALAFDGANHDPNQSGYYFEWEPSVLPDDSLNWGVLTFDEVANRVFYHPFTGGLLAVRAWYGAEGFEYVDDGSAGGETHYSGFVIDTDVPASLSAYASGAWTPPISSAGSLSVSTINLGVNSPYVIKFGPIRRYQAPLDEMKAQLEADIAAGEAA